MKTIPKIRFASEYMLSLLLIVATGCNDGSLTPPVFSPDNNEAIAAGWGHSMALKTDGMLWAWGSNQFGQLGDGSFTDKNSPVLIGTGYATIAAGGRHSLALKTDGTLFMWGNNDAGALGDGTLESKNVPIQIGNSFESIAAGDNYTLALKTDGTLLSWGYMGSWVMEHTNQGILRSR